MQNRVFPERSSVWKVLEEQLRDLRSRDLPHRMGQFFFFWRKPGDAVQLAAKEAASMFFNQLFIGELRQPSGAKRADDLQRMTLEILGAPADGACTLTSGGTESNFWAVKIARDRAREKQPQITEPEIVVPMSAHPSFEKAGHYLGVKTVRTPLGDDKRADVKAMAEAIGENTILVAGSSPCYPYGLCDPVAEIAELAEANALWCHVDSCVGGFIIPFLKKLGRDIPDFDFNIPGVHSISADLHKYGYTPPGMSTFSLRNRADQRYQIFDWKSSQWGGAGDYMTETLAGSRATDVLASAWTTMMMLGEEGYLKAARGLLETMELMKAGISAIDGLEVAFEPEVALFLFTSRQYDIVAVAEEMTARGYPTAWYELDHPVIHLLLDPLEDERQLEDYLETLTAVARDVADGKVKRSGEGAVYA